MAHHLNELGTITLKAKLLDYIKPKNFVECLELHGAIVAQANEPLTKTTFDGMDKDTNVYAAIRLITNNKSKKTTAYVIHTTETPHSTEKTNMFGMGDVIIEPVPTGLNPKSLSRVLKRHMKHCRAIKGGWRTLTTDIKAKPHKGTNWICARTDTTPMTHIYYTFN